MSQHPLNLGFRFLLEMAALLALAVWGSRQGEGALSVLLALGIPTLAAAVWAIFSVPGDRSRSGKAPVPVTGIVRLLIEFAVFASATWALYSVGAANIALVFGGAVLVHYALSYDRVKWLVQKE